MVTRYRYALCMQCALTLCGPYTATWIDSSTQTHTHANKRRRESIRLTSLSRRTHTHTSTYISFRVISLSSITINIWYMVQFVLPTYQIVQATKTLFALSQLVFSFYFFIYLYFIYFFPYAFIGWTIRLMAFEFVMHHIRSLDSLDILINDIKKRNKPSTDDDSKFDANEHTENWTE